MSQVSQVSSLNNDINFDYNFGNYNPNDVSVEETINAVFVIDTSSSIHPHVQDLNTNLNDFIERIENQSNYFFNLLIFSLFLKYSVNKESINLDLL